MEPDRRKIRRIITAAALICGAALLMLGIFTKIEEVTVTGNAWYSDQEIEERVFAGRLSRNSICAFVKELLGKKEEISFVDDYVITFRSPTSVDILVYEKSIVGYVSYMSAYMYFDKDGIVIESSNSPLEGVPLITGLKFGSISLYRELPVEDERVFGDILNLTQILSLYEIRTDRINYTEDRRADLYIGDIRVELGSNTDMNLKIAELNDMLPQLKGLKGTLYLDSFDKNSNSPAFTFKRN